MGKGARDSAGDWQLETDNPAGASQCG
jgi:hypothetical protein